ncbi:uncharacterized protein TNCV_5116331 [Trichonephila clavipes]|nr:uncharacterized protein TNCV_5116331 [Trichonephila clavipes]
MSAADIHRQITQVYGTETMIDSKVRKWVWEFKDGRTNVHDEERSGWPYVITNDLMQAVETKIHENRKFTITTFSLKFPDVSWSVVYKIVTEDVNFKKLCSRWVPRLFTVEQKDKRFVSSLDFLLRYKEEGDDMLNRIVTGDETWVFHITPESKQKSMEWRHTSFQTFHPFQTNAVKAHDYGNIVLEPAWCFVGGLYATRKSDQLRCLLCRSTEAPKRIAKQTARHAVKKCFAPPR